MFLENIYLARKRTSYPSRKQERKRRTREKREGYKTRDIFNLRILFNGTHRLHTVCARGSIKWIYTPRHNLSSFSNAHLKFFPFSSFSSLSSHRAIPTIFTRNLIFTPREVAYAFHPPVHISTHDPLLRFLSNASSRGIIHVYAVTYINIRATVRVANYMYRHYV